jgi:hypothetical protein
MNTMKQYDEWKDTVLNHGYTYKETIKCYECASNFVRNFSPINDQILYNYMYHKMELLKTDIAVEESVALCDNNVYNQKLRDNLTLSDKIILYIENCRLVYYFYKHILRHGFLSK